MNVYRITGLILLSAVLLGFGGWLGATITRQVLVKVATVEVPVEMMSGVTVTAVVTVTPLVALPTLTTVTTPTPLSNTSTPSPFVTPAVEPTVAPILPTPVPTVTKTPAPWLEQRTIGYSVQQRAIEMTRLGSGPRWYVLLGALHGGHECQTSGVVEGILNHFIANPDQLPVDITLYTVPLINQDGCVANRRGNANGVDLNRNWDTPDWRADAEAMGGVIVGSGGSHPFSEPETQILRDLLLNLQNDAPQHPLIVIVYHSAVPQTGLVQPGYLAPGQSGFTSAELATLYSQVSGYLYSETWVGNYTITGELIYWANLNNIVAMDVELPDRGPANSVPPGWRETHIETNLRAVLSLFLYLDP
jgi:hypothetical protein